jgi:EEF1A lysine methyltransferase 4
MSWATADLDWRSIQSTVGRNHGDSKPPGSDYRELYGDSMPSTPSACNATFSIVIEKSCADAIACGEDISIPVPYHLDQIVNRTKTTDEAIYIHPVCLLAIHLAALTKLGGTWIVLSYSETRFDCCVGEEGGDAYFHGLMKVGAVPDPALLWIMIMNVHRPRIAHWLYIFRRTDHAVA